MSENNNLPEVDPGIPSNPVGDDLDFDSLIPSQPEVSSEPTPDNGDKSKMIKGVLLLLIIVGAFAFGFWYMSKDKGNSVKPIMEKELNIGQVVPATVESNTSSNSGIVKPVEKKEAPTTITPSDTTATKSQNNQDVNPSNSGQGILPSDANQATPSSNQNQANQSQPTQQVSNTGNTTSSVTPPSTPPQEESLEEFMKRNGAQ